MRQRLYNALRGLFALAGLVFIGLALRDALADPDLTVVPPARHLVVAVVVVVVGMWSATVGWARLLGRRDPRSIARGFLLAQLGKYIPGGVWQIIGQVTDATRTTANDGRAASLAFVVSVATQVTAGLLVGLPLVLVDTTPTWIRLCLLAGALVAVGLLLQRRLLARILLALPWLRDTSTSDAMPSRSAIVVSTVANCVALVAAGIVFDIANVAGPDRGVLVVVPAFALAWTIGFLAIPFPAGLGIREGALLLLLPGGSSTAIVAASAVVRVIYIAGELLALGIAWLPGIRAPEPHRSPD